MHIYNAREELLLIIILVEKKFVLHTVNKWLQYLGKDNQRFWLYYCHPLVVYVILVQKTLLEKVENRKHLYHSSFCSKILYPIHLRTSASGAGFVVRVFIKAISSQAA